MQGTEQGLLVVSRIEQYVVITDAYSRPRWNIKQRRLVRVLRQYPGVC